MTEENKENKELKKEETNTKPEAQNEKEVQEVKKVKQYKKDFAIAKGISMRISQKYSMAICRIIKGKSPEQAITRLEAVVKGKRSIPMPSREVPHQRGKGIAGARFPKTACSEIIKVIKQGQANASVSGIENPIITIAKADLASAPFRRDGTKGKRTHLYLEIRSKNKLTKEKNRK